VQEGEGIDVIAKFFAATLSAVVCLSAPAQAADLEFRAALDGRTLPTITGSSATGTATVRVHTEAQTVDMSMTIHGISRDQLWDHVIHSGRGPVHLHLYAENGDISLLVPFPYGASYADSADGFTLNVENYSYAEGAALLGSEMSFDEFVATLGTAFVYINVHTDTVTEGEISGRLAPAT
jgi:hypothetical protein